MIINYVNFQMWKILIMTLLLQTTFTPIKFTQASNLILDEYRPPANLKVTLSELIKQRFRPEIINGKFECN